MWTSTSNSFMLNTFAEACVVGQMLVQAAPMQPKPTPLTAKFPGWGILFPLCFCDDKPHSILRGDLHAPRSCLCSTVEWLDPFPVDLGRPIFQRLATRRKRHLCF